MQDVADGGFKRLGVESAREVDEGGVCRLRACHLSNQFQRFIINGCPILHIVYLREDTGNQCTQLALLCIKGAVFP